MAAGMEINSVDQADGQQVEQRLELERQVGENVIDDVFDPVHVLGISELGHFLFDVGLAPVSGQIGIVGLDGDLDEVRVHALIIRGRFRGFRLIFRIAAGAYFSRIHSTQFETQNPLTRDSCLTISMLAALHLFFHLLCSYVPPIPAPMTMPTDNRMIPTVHDPFLIPLVSDQPLSLHSFNSHHLSASIHDSFYN